MKPYKNITKDKNWTLRKRGFTLVELIVSMAITGILMLGMSAFFSSTFRNMFEAQSRSMSTERQFAINEIIRNKFSSLDFLIKDSADYILSFNKNTKNQLPFSYIGTTEIDSKNYLAFRDIMLFNKIFAPIGSGAHIYANANTGELMKATDNTSAGKTLTDLKNVGGFVTKDDGVTHYVAMPNENVIRICAITCNTILDVSPLTLSTPMDIETDGNNFYISDAGNNRIIMVIMKPDGTTVDEAKIIAEDLNFPTGLSYYDNGAEEFLFAADTFNHKIKRITVPPPPYDPPYDIVTVVGDGEDGQCNKTAKFCKLNLPTGVFAYAPDNELYIADSGNNRILKMSDPEPTENTATNLELEFELDDYYAWDKMVLSDVLDEGDSNIISNLPSASYSDSTHEIRNNLNPTVAHNNQNCNLTNKLYVKNDLGAQGVINGDHLVINSIAYVIDSMGSKTDCDPTPEVTDWAYPIDISLVAGAQLIGGISHGDLVYVSNPMAVDIELANVKISENGFKTIQIDTYSVENFKTPVETDYTSIRVGNNILGTEEDEIEVIAANAIDNPICEGESCIIQQDGSVESWSNEILFPTGITNAYFIGSGNGRVFKLLLPSNEPGNTMINFDESSIDSFDYISDFELAAVDPIAFTKYNCATPDDCSILELEIATVNQTYKLNAAIP